jgi:hypothetical protein
MRKLSLLRLIALAAAYTATRMLVVDGVVVAVLFFTHWIERIWIESTQYLGNHFAVGEDDSLPKHAELFGKDLRLVGEKF